MLLELDRVSSGYGRSPVLHDVSLSVGAGEIVALIGANGAGKSTLLNTVMGLVPISAGESASTAASIARLPTPAIVRAGIAQVPERRQLFGTMTVEENLLHGRLHRRRPPRGGNALEEQFSRLSRSCASGAASSRARCPAASSRWWRSRAPRCRGRGCCCWTSRRSVWRRCSSRRSCSRSSRCGRPAAPC